MENNMATRLSLTLEDFKYYIYSQGYNTVILPLRCINIPP